VTWFQALVLGAIQGATEFLPISSSGHLVLLPWLFGWEIESAVLLPFAVVMHWGTLLALVAAFRSDLKLLASAAFRGVRRRDPFGSSHARLAWLLLVATLPAAIAGVTIGDVVGEAFARPEWVAALLLITAGLLMMGEWFRSRADSEEALSKLGVSDAVVIGLFQVLALLPGISRSGSTIVGSLSRGFSRLESARFALLLAVPVTLGAGLVELGSLRAFSSDSLLQLALGFVAATAVGVAAIRWLLRFLSHGSLRGFAVYCAILGTLGLAVSIYRG